MRQRRAYRKANILRDKISKHEQKLMWLRLELEQTESIAGDYKPPPGPPRRYASERYGG